MENAAILHSKEQLNKLKTAMCYAILISQFMTCFNSRQLASKLLLTCIVLSIVSLASCFCFQCLSNRLQVSMGYRLINHAGCW